MIVTHARDHRTILRCFLAPIIVNAFHGAVQIAAELEVNVRLVFSMTIIAVQLLQDGQ
jgi:hypothetical protein